MKKKIPQFSFSFSTNKILSPSFFYLGREEKRRKDAESRGYPRG